MRILTYLPELEAAGGVALHTLQVSGELAARGHQIDLVYERDGDLTDEFRSFCESVSRERSPVYSASPVADIARIIPLVLAASRRRPDIIHTNNMSELLWADGIRALTRAPIVCHLHEFRPFSRVSMATLCRPVNRFVAVSQFLQDAWSQHGLDADRIEVIPNGFALSAYPPGSAADRLKRRELLGLPADAYVVLCMGRIIPEKGVDVLLEAWKRLGLSPDQARLVIVGVPSGSSDYVRGLQAQAPPGCEWLPMRRDVVSVLHAADVLVLPAVWDEPFGRVIVEAMATGRPAVASAVGGIPGILDGEFSRMLFPRGDASALAERLRALVGWRRDDPDLENRCIEHVARRYALADVVTRLESLFVDARRHRTSAGSDLRS
jgi:glycosyltransferase involved in cell wall biosynthesis